MTNAIKPHEGEKKHLDRLLDEALVETFPASDPIAVSPQDEPLPEDHDAERDGAH